RFGGRRVVSPGLYSAQPYSLPAARRFSSKRCCRAEVRRVSRAGRCVRTRPLRDRSEGDDFLELSLADRRQSRSRWHSRCPGKLAEPGEIAMSLLRVPVNSSDHVQGPDDAPVTLLEYGDYECPHCGQMHPVVQQLQRQFGLRLRFAYRHFPLTEIHQYAEPAAEPAEYAGFYGRFGAAHVMLVENQE